MARPVIGRYLYNDGETQRTFEIVHLESQDKLLFTQSIDGSEALTGELAQRADGTWHARLAGGFEPEEISLTTTQLGATLRRGQGETVAHVLTMSKKWLRIIDQHVKAGETMLIDAAPGSGKSTVLREWCRANPDSEILVLAYNRAVRDQLEKNFSELPNVKTMTIHELAYSATHAFHHHKVGDPTKTDLKKLLEDIEGSECEWLDVDEAKACLETFSTSSAGWPQDSNIHGLWDHFMTGRCCVKMPHNVYLKIFQIKTELQEQVLMPFDAVVVDEAQDCTDCMLCVIQAQSKPTVLACDPRQNIYQFNHVTGEALRDMPVTHHKDLPESFRFGPVAARFLSRIASIEGKKICGASHLSTQLLFDVSPVQAYDKLLDRGEKVTVLARKNATLFAEASAIATNRGPTGRGRVRTMAMIGSFEKFRENVLNPVLDLYHMKNGQRQRVKNNYLRCFPTLERFELTCKQKRDVDWLSRLALLRDHGSSLPTLIVSIERKIVQDTSVADVVLSTVHQAKGLGFRNVLLLDDFLDPVESDDDDEYELDKEERNILYVAASRVASGELLVGPGTSARCKMHGFDARSFSDTEDEYSSQSSQSARADNTIEEIEHTEPAAVIPPKEAQQVVDESWAQFVEHCASSAVSTRDEVAQDTEGASTDSLTGLETADVTSTPSVAQSAPAATAISECLLPDTRVLLNRSDAHVMQLEPGTELRTPQVQRPAILRELRILQRRDRDITTIRFSSKNGALTGTLMLTSSHVVAARRLGGPVFRPTLVSELSVGLLLRTNTSDDATIIELNSQVLHTAVVQIELEDSRSSFFAVSSGEGQAFIEVYGSLAPISDQVKILSFYRCDGFFEIFLESEDLRACRDALTRNGLSMDLGVCNLGPGKLVVSANVAPRVVEALKLRGRVLNSSQIVVSRDMEPVVLELVRRHARRSNPVKKEEAVDLSNALPRKTPRDREASVEDLTVKRLRTERTFIDIGEPRPRSVVTRSTTDAHLGVGQNPRMVAPRLTASQRPVE